MAGTFLTKSRHGTVYYFRRRVPAAARRALGHSMYVQSLLTSDRRLAVIRGRALAAHTDSIFQRIAMATKFNDPDGFALGYEIKFDFNDLGGLSSLCVKAEPEEQEAVNSAIRAALGSRPRRKKTRRSGFDGARRTPDYLRRRTPAMPSTPRPSRASDAGSGTCDAAPMELTV